MPTHALPETLDKIFLDTTLSWGNKHPRDTLLRDLWENDRDYLLWAANLKTDKPNKYSLPRYQSSLVALALEISGLSAEESEAKLNELQRWRILSREGTGLSSLSRPTRDDCRNIIARCNLLGVHGDLDGIFSGASAICYGGALEGGKLPGGFHRVRLFRYGFRSLADYSDAFFTGKSASGRTSNENETCSVVIDFAAHPHASLNLDHHTTALSFWEFGTDIPVGIFDPKFPSCPRLLADCCGLPIPEPVLAGCDMVDGARYASIGETSTLDNPFVALEYALGVEVSDIVATKALFTLAEAKLDPYSLLEQPVWKARVELVRLEFDEQRSYWSKSSRFQFFEDLLAVSDARLAPYSSSRFRYIPFENETVVKYPYLVTIRPKSQTSVNLGISRNPFYREKEFFDRNPKNLGAIAKALGEGGGRLEASAVTIEVSQLSDTIRRILALLQEESLS